MHDVSPSILITDDDRAFRETLRSVFAPRGFETHVAADGEEAVTIVRRERIHLVLLDMHMPRLSGLETMHAVKEVNDSLPCVLISAGIDSHLREAAIAADVFEILEKPVELDAVTAVVAKAFRQTYDWPL